MAKKPAQAATKPPTPAPAVDAALLGHIVAATNANSFVYTSAAQHAPLVAADLAIVNPAIVNPADATQLATIATDAGKAYVANPPGASPAPGPWPQPGAAPAAGGAPATPAPSNFTIIKGAALPEPKKFGSGGAQTVYPFETMEPGDSFFIPKTAERDNPAKSLASTVSSANLRYATEKSNPDGSPMMRTTRKGNEVRAVEFTRQYIARSVKAGVVYGAFTAPADGALIQRIK